MEIKIYPERIAQGGRVTVHAGPYDPKEYDYLWEYPDFDAAFALPGDSEAERRVDTSQLQPGAYKIRVSAAPREAGSKRARAEAIREGRGEVGEAFITVDPAPISPRLVEGMLERAENIVERLSGNLARRPGEAPRPGRGSDVSNVDGDLPVLRVSLTPRMAGGIPDDGNLALWQAIRNRTDAISFRPYREFVDRVMCPVDDDETGSAHPELPARERLGRRRQLTISELHGVDAFNLLRATTETFLVMHAGVFVQPPVDPLTGLPGPADVVPPNEVLRVEQPRTFAEIQATLNAYLGNGRLPYLSRILSALGEDRLIGTGYPECVIDDGFRRPLFLELIWSYWHEEGMLVQAINAISLRFQNRRGAVERDPLASLETEPLRPLNNLLWGYIQDEIRRLSVPRRAYEYAHEYGLALYGKAVGTMNIADNRSKFIEAFHNLLYLATVFYKQADDTTVNADPFPLLNALREVHLILAQGAHNQFGDLPWTARVEMLIQQWLLARRETNEFLRGRYMVPYEEDWMGPVDTMKTLQGWTDTTISHFHRLARFGEQLLLSIRYTDWADLNQIAENARTWGLYWRPEVQAYIHSYRAATGVDLAADSAAKQPAELRYRSPAELLRQRLNDRRNGRNGSGAALPAGKPAEAATAHTSFRERKAQRSSK